MKRSEEVVVVGMGVFCAIGSEMKAFWASLLAGRDGMRGVATLDPMAFSARIAGLVPDEERARVLKEGEGVDPCVSYALVAAREAQTMADERGGAVPSSRVGLVFGTSMGSHETWMRYNDLHRAGADRALMRETFSSAQFGVETAQVADALGIKGPRLTISTACTSSTHAMGLACELLHEERADRVFVVGSDPFALGVFAGFYTLGVMSASPCAPFGEPVGMNIGEGAGALVLEREADALQRKASIYAYLRGYGLSVDAFHPTTPEPAGKGIARSIREALWDASMKPQDIGYYNAHGTGTASNDAAEWKAVQQVFGTQAQHLPVSSTKSYLGHTQGAAGILEAIATILALREQLCLPTLHLHTKRRQAPDDPVAEATPRPCAYEAAISHNSAFGGLNATVIFSRNASQHASTQTNAPSSKQAEPSSKQAEPSSKQSIAEPSSKRLHLAMKQSLVSEVYVLGVGSVGPQGRGGLLAALRDGKALKQWPQEDRWLASERKQAGYVPVLEAGEMLRRGETRGMDDISRYLTVASAAALQDARVSIRGDLRERTGLFVGVSRIPAESSWRYLRIARERGWHRAPAHEFARLVLNAPAGACSLALALRGAGTTLVGAGSGLMAAIYGVWWLRSRPSAELMLVGGCDELGDDDLRELEEGTHGEGFLAEGAGVAVLGGAEICERESILPRIRVRAVSVMGSINEGTARAEEISTKDSFFDWMQRAGQPDAVFWAGRSAEKISLFQERMSAFYGTNAAKIPVWQPFATLGYARATSASWALAAACESMREDRCSTETIESTEMTRRDASSESLADGAQPLWGCDRDGKPPRCAWVITEDALCGLGLLSLESIGSL